jgi:pimeloyl-ACP methyl ester carboxylesterase
MEGIILVHGIMGSKLTLGNEEIWPPSLGEVLSKPPHYKRIAKLKDQHATATGIVFQYTSVYQVYGPIIKDLDDIIAAQGGIRPDFWYDWRDELTDSADRLAKAIADLCSGPNPATSVTLVAHSMGGLVARLVLESGKYKKASWFGKITRLVAICVPHVGAPIAVARALGLEGSTTILPADMKTLMNDSNLPAGFELFPAAPAYRKNALYDVKNGVLDIYDAGTANTFGLSKANQSASLTSWSKLDFSKRPKGVRYISIAGTGLPTENAYYYDKTQYRLTSSVDGDGTVPLWSSSFGPVDKLYTLPGDHIAIMNTNKFRQTLQEIFGSVIFGSVMAVAFQLAEQPGVSVSLHKRDLQPGETMEVLLVPDNRTTNIDGKLHVKSVSAAADGTSMNLNPIGMEVPVAYQGPPIASLPLVITAPQTHGAYVLTFEGTHGSTTETSAAFFVSHKAAIEVMAAPHKASSQVPKKSAKTKSSKKAGKSGK